MPFAAFSCSLQTLAQRDVHNSSSKLLPRWVGRVITDSHVTLDVSGDAQHQVQKRLTICDHIGQTEPEWPNGGVDDTDTDTSLLDQTIPNIAIKPGSAVYQ